MTGIQDRIDFYFNPARSFNHRTIYITVANSDLHLQHVDFTIRAREYMPKDTFDTDLKARNDVFFDALDGTDAHATSFKERTETVEHDEIKFIYGEILHSTLLPLLQFVDPQPGETLYDLGCGSGRVMMVAAMAFPQLKACVGIELMPKVYELGSQIMSKFEQLCQ